MEKYAVRVGGGRNHRFALDDGILIKDNHNIACGGIKEAVARARKIGHHLLRIEVEASDLKQVEQALEAGADVIMLDNMSLKDVRKAVTLVAGRVLVEVSGNVTREKLAELAKAGVDIISVGAITHSAKAVDISMRVSV